jgi:hypothetical protein
VKHTETTAVKLREFVNLRYNVPIGGIFRMPTGTKPLVAVKVLNYKKDVLIECMYVITGHKIVHTGDKDVVPLKLGTFEDDNDYEIIDTEEYYNETYY